MTGRQTFITRVSKIVFLFFHLVAQSQYMYYRLKSLDWINFFFNKEYEISKQLWNASNLVKLLFLHLFFFVVLISSLYVNSVTLDTFFYCFPSSIILYYLLTVVRQRKIIVTRVIIVLLFIYIDLWKLIYLTVFLFRVLQLPHIPAIVIIDLEYTTLDYFGTANLIVRIEM